MDWGRQNGFRVLLWSRQGMKVAVGLESKLGREAESQDLVIHCGRRTGRGSDGKESARDTGDPGSIPGSGRSPGEGNGYPLQYSCLRNSMDRGDLWAIVHRVTKRWTQLKLLSTYAHIRSVYFIQVNKS